MNDSEDRPDLVDTLLRERAGADAQPDLTDTVLARLQRGEAGVQAGRLRWQRATFPRRARAWLAAAVLLLGLGVVAAVAFTRGEQEAVAVEPSQGTRNEQDPVRQEPEPSPPDQTPASASLPFELEVVEPNGQPVPLYAFDLLRLRSRDPLAYERAGSFVVHIKVGDAPAAVSRASRATKFDRKDIGYTPGDPIADGDYVVVVDAAGESARTASEPFTVVKGTRPAVKVRLGAGIAFYLQVVTLAGKPIEDVVVTSEDSKADRGAVSRDGKRLYGFDELFAPNLLSAKRSKTMPSGNVTFIHMTPGKYRLVFEHPDYCTTVLDPVEVPLAAPLEPVRMIPGAVVRGTLKGSAEAVAGAKLTLSPKDGTTPSAGLWPMVTLANAKGEFAFDSRIPAGAYFITPVRQPPMEHLLVDERGVMRDSVEVVVEEGKDVLEVALVCGAESSSSQQPAPDAEKPVEQDPAKVLPVAFTLRVIDPDGAPVPRMAVQLLAAYRGGSSFFNYSPVMRFDELQPRSNKDGSTTGFSVRETATNEREVRGTLSAGEFIIEVESELHSRTTSKPFAIGNGKAPPLVEVTMTPCHEVRLQLATVHGKPIGGAVVTTIPNRADPRTDYLEPAGVRRMDLRSELRVESDGSGVAVLRPVRAGNYVVRIEHPSFCTTVLDPVEVPLAAPLEPVRMIPGAVVRGTVKGSAEAIAGAKLTLSPKDGTTPSAGLWPMVTLANAKGEFAFDSHVPPGAYRMTPLREPSTAHVLSNAQGVVRDSVEFAVEEGQTEVQIDPRIHGN